mgnify:CR=1 FL=1
MRLSLHERLFLFANYGATKQAGYQYKQTSRQFRSMRRSSRSFVVFGGFAHATSRRSLGKIRLGRGGLARSRKGVSGDFSFPRCQWRHRQVVMQKAGVWRACWVLLGSWERCEGEG